jgi:hypothetical protein
MTIEGTIAAAAMAEAITVADAQQACATRRGRDQRARPR